jgi:hypothetical protein
LIGRDVVQRNQNGWLIDFLDLSEDKAALYELPFEYVRKVVKPKRDNNNRQRSKDHWWLHGENRPGMRRAIGGLHRCIVTPATAKYRIFAWMSTDVVPDQQVRVIARDDDYFLGVLQSRLHETWSLGVGSTLEDRPRYTATACFETFPFPWRPGSEPKDSPLVEAIAEAARELVAKRDAWLNPPGASAEDLKKRTLTNLYNARPAWLADVHRKLDQAVFAAYGWPATLTDAELLEHLLALNHARAGAQEPEKGK